MKMPWHILVSGVMAASVAGCKVGPDYHAPATTVPANWSEPVKDGLTHDNAAIAQWWTTFHDSTLDSLIARAVKSNPDLAIAAARVRQARAQRASYGADLWPTADASGSYSRERVSKNQPLLGSLLTSPGAPNVPFENDVYQAGFDASWEIDVFGGKRRALEAATADLAASVEGQHDASVSLLAEVARDYIELRSLQQRLTIAQANIKLQEQAVALTRARFESGVTTDLDVAQAAAQLAGTQAEVPTLESAIQQRMHQLAILLGQEPGALVAQLSPKRAIPPVPPKVPVGLPSELLRRRPDVRRAERELAAETARIGVQTAELFPKFSLTGNLGVESIHASTLLEGDSLLWSIGPSMQWRIFDAGKIRANIRVQNAVQEEALATYEKTVLGSLRDVEDALIAYEKEQARHRALRNEAAQYQRALDIANAQYTQGRSNFLNVLDAQRALYMAQDNLAQSDDAVAQNLIALYKALGGGWDDAAMAALPAATEPAGRSLP